MSLSINCCGVRFTKCFQDSKKKVGIVQVLDELQAATFHWQWVELRLLLNEQVVLEKLKTHSQSAQEAVQAAMQGTDRQQLAECEKTFTEVVLTRLLVRPDAAGLYSEAVHSLGRALEEYLILQVLFSGIP